MGGGDLREKEARLGVSCAINCGQRAVTCLLAIGNMAASSQYKGRVTHDLERGRAALRLEAMLPNSKFELNQLLNYEKQQRL
jgi:hypothetical protein